VRSVNRPFSLVISSPAPGACSCPIGVFACPGTAPCGSGEGTGSESTVNGLGGRFCITALWPVGFCGGASLSAGVCAAARMPPAAMAPAKLIPAIQTHVLQRSCIVPLATIILFLQEPEPVTVAPSIYATLPALRAFPPSHHALGDVGPFIDRPIRVCSNSPIRQIARCCIGYLLHHFPRRI